MRTRDFFSEYIMQGVTRAENEIFLELDPDRTARTLGSLKNTNNAKSVKIKLTRKHNLPCLTFELELSSLNLAASGGSRHCVHDVPVSLVPRSQWHDFREPEMPPFAVSLYLPELKTLKSLVERYKNLGSCFSMQAHRSGKLKLVLETDLLNVVTHFRDCKVPRINEAGLDQSRFGAFNDATRTMMAEHGGGGNDGDGGNGGSSGDEEGEDAGFVSVRVELRKLNQLLSAEQVGPTKIIANFVPKRMIHMFLIHDEVCIQYFIPAISE